ncbi:MAG: hypothetical protein JWO36_4360 [Myxococcales bacterium]|nr:hypothetical protein [Myxococcales bacterium]
MRNQLAMLVMLAIAACSHPPPPAAPVVVVPKKTRLSILPAESDAFPKAAKALTESLTSAHVSGVDDTQISKVSLEVVQLSIECVDATVACFQAAGRSLSANQLLFAQISAEPKKHLRVTVTLFDVDTQTAKKTQEKVFANDTEATAGVAELVSEATKP